MVGTEIEVANVCRTNYSWQERGSEPGVIFRLQYGDDVA